MDIAYLIEMILVFVIDHIGLVIGILIMAASISSVRKKAKQAREEQETNGQGQQSRPVKSFRDLMAEIEAELEEDEDWKPWKETTPQAPQTPVPPQRTEAPKGPNIPPLYREESAGRQFPPQEGPHPWERSVNRAPVSPKAAPQYSPVTPKAAPSNIPVKPGVHPQSAPLAADMNIPDDLTKSDAIKAKKKTNRPAKRNELVTAVIMSEVLGKPKGLQD